MASPFGIGPYGKGHYSAASTPITWDVSARSSVHFLAHAIVAGIEREFLGVTGITFMVTARTEVEVAVNGVTQIEFWVDAPVDVTWPGYEPCMPGLWAPVDLANRVPVQ